MALLVGCASLAAGLIFVETSGAFSAAAGSAGTLKAGRVDLSDGAPRKPGAETGEPLFAVRNMAAGQSEARCVRLSYTGSIFPAAVRMFGENAGGAGGLADFLSMSVDLVKPGLPFDSPESCVKTQRERRLFPTAATPAGADTVTGFFAQYQDMSSGLPIWSPSSTEDASAIVRITLTLRDDPAAQSKTATPNFAWEAIAS